MWAERWNQTPDSSFRAAASSRSSGTKSCRNGSPLAGEHVYTVAAQTDTAGLLYLTVGVVRQQDGSLALAGYPAFVGAPASTAAQAPAHLREVAGTGAGHGGGTGPAQLPRRLRRRAGGRPDEWRTSLASRAAAQPAVGAAPELVEPGGSPVLAAVQAQDGRGAQYTLDYEIDVSRVQGRWEVSAVQMDPDD